MKNRRWHDYDDGFDEVALHDDEELEFRSLRRRPKLRIASRQRERERERVERFEDSNHRQRIARVKAWGVPY